MGPLETSAATVDLAEKPTVLRNGLTVRQIRRRLANGRQVPVITTHPQLPLDQVASARFSRWSQENFFKYLREQFNLDSLPTHDLAPIDPDAQVVNPAVAALMAARYSGGSPNRARRCALLAGCSVDVSPARVKRRDIPSGDVRVISVPAALYSIVCAIRSTRSPSIREPQRTSLLPSTLHLPTEGCGRSSSYLMGLSGPRVTLPTHVK